MSLPPFAIAAYAAVIWSAFAVRPWPKLWVASATLERGGGSWPRISPGRPTPVRSPRPNAPSDSCSPARPSRSPILAAPMFELTARIFDAPAQPRPS